MNRHARPTAPPTGGDTPGGRAGRGEDVGGTSVGVPWPRGESRPWARHRRGVRADAAPLTRVPLPRSVPVRHDRRSQGPGTLGGWAPSRVPATMVGWLRQHSVVAGNALGLYGSTLVTSALGFAFWWLAARSLPAGEVGLGSAGLSAVQLVATLSIVGLNTLLLGELAQDPQRAPTLLTSACATVAVTGTVGALGVAGALALSSDSYQQMFGSPLRIAAFVLAVVVTGLTLVLDDACVGLLRSGLQLRRNAVFAVAKLALLPVTTLLLPAGRGCALVLAWAIGALGSLAAVRPLARVGTARRRVDRALLRAIAGPAIRHHWLNVAVLAPRFVLPVLAVPLLGEASTAALYTAVMIVSFVNVVPFHLSTVLFAIAPGDERRLRREMRFTLTVSAGLAVVGGLLLAVGAGWTLSVFGHGYTVAAPALVVLGLATFPMAVKSHYVAVSRVKGLLSRAAWTSSLGAGAEVLAAAVGGVRGGLTGFAVGMVLAQCLEAVVFAPTVWRALHGRLDIPSLPRARADLTQYAEAAAPPADPGDRYPGLPGQDRHPAGQDRDPAAIYVDLPEQDRDLAEQYVDLAEQHPEPAARFLASTGWDGHGDEQRT